MAKLLIVGASGFLGRELCAQALAAGDRPFAFAPDVDEATLPKGAHRLPGDVTDPDSVRTALDDAAPDGIVHVASFGIGGEGLRASADLDRLKAIEVNIAGFVVMAEAVLDANIARMVWASSAAVYGRATPEQPFDEDVPPSPITFYGATKAACEVLAGPMFASAPERFTSIRLPTVYGAGRYPGAQAKLVHFVEDIANNVPALLTASNEPTDWIHVEDAARVLLDVVRRDCPHQLYNVVGHTAGIASTGREVAKHATADAAVDEGAPSGFAPPLMDDTRARQTLSFSPQFDFASGVAQYVDAMRSTRRDAH